MTYWLCYGKTDKWLPALEYSRWGVKSIAINNDVSSPAKDWEKVRKDDIVILQMSDNKLYGWGIVQGTTDTEKTLIWPDEIRKSKVIYDRRIIFEMIDHCDVAFQEQIEFIGLTPFKNAGLGEITNQKIAKEAIEKMKKIWNSSEISFS